jgi:hypothetical protein
MAKRIGKKIISFALSLSKYDSVYFVKKTPPTREKI